MWQIDSMCKDGKFIGTDGTVPEGQGIVMAHLNECHELLEMVRLVRVVGIEWLFIADYSCLAPLCVCACACVYLHAYS